LADNRRLLISLVAARQRKPARKNTTYDIVAQWRHREEEEARDKKKRKRLKSQRLKYHKWRRNKRMCYILTQKSYFLGDGLELKS
jgi:hypothetical protein